MSHAISLTDDELESENGMFVQAGVPIAIREDPVLGEKFRLWVRACRRQEELKRLAAEINEIGRRISKGDAAATGELRRVGESLIAMASA